jgi:hypothetical protein
MSDSHQKVTTQGWFSRIGDSIKGILVGVVLFIAAFPLLWLNEGRSVKRYKALNEGEAVTVHVDSQAIDPAMEGKLVHTTGKAVTDEVLQDSQFPVSDTVLRLRRNVSMYQWVEETRTEKKKKVGGSEETITTYTYKQQWCDQLIDSTNFDKPQGHQNPVSMPFEDEEYQVSSASLGAFQLTPDQISRISTFQPKNLTADTPIPQDIADRTVIVGNSFYVAATPLVTKEDKLEDGTVKTTLAPPTAPQIGDVKVSFEFVPNNIDISLMYQQQGATFVPFQTKHGAIAELRTGLHSQEEMYASARSANRMLTWILRILGLVIMYIGISTIFRPLSVLADVVPFIGTIVRTGTGIISFLIALVLSLLTIALAWLFYRPVLSIILLVVIVGLILLIVKKCKKA